MQVLFDTDIVLNLAALDVLADVCALLNVSASDVCVPSGAVFKLRHDRGGRLATRYGTAGLARAVAFLTAAASCDVDPERLAALNVFAARADVDGLDEGEAELLAMASETAPCVLVSGDKRWPPALQSGDLVCARVNTLLEGQVMCFEQTVLRLVASTGFASVRRGHLAYPSCDEALRIAFTSRPQTVVEATVVEGLQSFVETLRRVSGTLLVP